MQAPPRRRRNSLYRRRRRRPIVVAAAVLAGFLFSGTAGAAWYFAPALTTAVGDTGHAIHRAGSSGGGAGANNGSPAPDQPFTVLLLGSDNDAKFSGSVVLTQSMILTRVDPATKQVTMLSIPRDLYVPLATGGTDKIDKAYAYGGADAAIATVERDFGVHIDHYAWIGLLGLVHLIDQVGGVDIVATNPIVDDNYPKDLSGTNPYDIQRVAVLPGPQHMDGITALQYVRSRHGDGARSDFGRSQRQQQILVALRAKAKLLGIPDLPDVASAMGKDFDTDMTLGEVQSLLPLATGISLANVHQLILASPYSTGQVIGVQDVLVPHWTLILPLVHKYFPET